MAKRLPKGWVQGSVQELFDLTDEEAEALEERLHLEAARKEPAEGDSVPGEDVKAELDILKSSGQKKDQ
jgi:hypothetical protein